MVRAGLRIHDLDYLYGQRFGGPWFHLFVHGGCFAALFTMGFFVKIERKRVNI